MISPFSVELFAKQFVVIMVTLGMGGGNDNLKKYNKYGVLMMWFWCIKKIDKSDNKLQNFKWDNNKFMKIEELGLIRILENMNVK